MALSDVPKSRFTHRGLYAIVDSTVHADYGLARLIKDIVFESAIPVVQFRLKNMDHKEKLHLIATACDYKTHRDIVYIVNDDTDLINTTGIDGVHLGQKDMNFSLAKKAYPTTIMGLSTHSVQEAKQAQELGASYIGCGAVFNTSTKNDTQPLGLSGLRDTVQAVSIPTVAIGGINHSNLSQVIETGCSMAAVISGLVQNGKFLGGLLQENYVL